VELASQDGGAVVTEQIIIARAAKERVRAALTLQIIVAVLAVEMVVAVMLAGQAVAVSSPTIRSLSAPPYSVSSPP